MPKVDGMDLLRAALRDDPTRPVVMITAHGTVDNAVEALKTGAFDYLTKPFDQSEVRVIVKKALRTRDLASADASRDVAAAGVPKEGGARFGIIGESPPILELYAILERVADTPTTVLVTGESGTGKELVARALHENSSRRDRPFIKVNCAAIPKDLMEAELFGHERGAFTGAVASKPGRFELASGGTLFLDEIGEIPNEMQVKLLRVLQERTVKKVGGVTESEVDVRIVAATNRDLEAEVERGGFRRDLFYRLNVIELRLPPLRARREDVPLLVEHFVKKHAAALGRTITAIEPDALAALVDYDFPGNVRELENIIERAVTLEPGERITRASLPELTQKARPATAVGDTFPDDGVDLEHLVADYEREIINRALEHAHGVRKTAAKLLGISFRSLRYRLAKLGLAHSDDSDDDTPT
jgi:two-component system response regulator AtoC